jgi:selenide,water dikinase
VLSDLHVPADARVLIDFRTADDAGVYALGRETALVQTVDFFTPIVDDPFAYGRIAAANALSDVYAMGAEPITALAIAAFPVKGFDPDDIKAIFAGGLATLQEAGVSLLGGHTVQDSEVKFGYAVTGLVHPARVWANASARVGDRLLLTKPLGTGIITTALKHQRAPVDAVSAALDAMMTLNRAAAAALRGLGAGAVSACTDITGFGLIGHGCEIADASGVTAAIDVDVMPLLPQVLELARRNRPGGLATNEQFFGPRVRRTHEIDPNLDAVLFDPQTSGGLLAALAPERLADAVAAFEQAGVFVRVVGEVLSREGASLVLR